MSADYAALAREAEAAVLPPSGTNQELDTAEHSRQGVRLQDFWAYMPMHLYVFAPSRELWPAASVNARLPKVGKIKPSAWLDRNRSIEQMTWAPGEPMVIGDQLISDGGWIDRPGCHCFNLYRPPTIGAGDAAQAARWLRHVHQVYPTEAEHIIAWLAHRVQRPQEKINHALVLGGLQGIGKDTILEPVKHAVGPWNFCEVSPAHLFGRFNGFVKSVILRVSEARDLGGDGQEFSGKNRYGFYEHMKTLTAAPPDVLRVDEKNIREYNVFNVCGVVFTTNYKDGIYLPVDDRRHFVAWSELTKEDFTQDYWKDLYTWYEREGYRHVAAYLTDLNISEFNPKSPPHKTVAFRDAVDASRGPEDAEIGDALDRLGKPDATTLTEIAEHANPPLSEWLRDRKNNRQIPHRMLTAGYVTVRNDSQKDGRWKVGGKNQMIYARHELPLRDRMAAAQRLVEAAR